MAQPQSRESILLLGATGYIGGYILEQLIAAKDNFSRIAIFTSQGTAENKSQELDGFKQRGVEVIVGDVRSSDDLLRAFEGITTVISAAGRNVIAEQINWIKLTTQSPSVKRFFPSEYGTDIEYGPKSATEVIHQQKLKVRAALREAESKGLEHTFIVTGPYADVDTFLGPGTPFPEAGSYDVQKKKAILLEDGKERVSLTTMSDVGRFVAKAILHPEASRNRALRVNSFTTTPAGILAEFERQTGGDRWDVSYTSLDELRKLEEQAFRDEHPARVVLTVKRIWGEGGTLYETRDNGLIDAEQTDSLEEAVRAAISVQTASK